MRAIKARIAAITASFIVATLSAWGLSGLTPEVAAAVERWISHTFELVLLLGYAVFHPLIARVLSRAEAERAKKAATRD